ncbi:hypothetical protein [Streptomyces sp. NPDC055109]
MSTSSRRRRFSRRSAAIFSRSLLIKAVPLARVGLGLVTQSRTAVSVSRR